MVNKSVYQCNKSCKTCTYEHKNPDGYDSFSECLTDKCPFNHYKLGYIDNVGGRHTEEGNWNPKGEFCSICNEESCETCSKWETRQQIIKTTSHPTTNSKTVKNNTPNWNAIFDDVIDFNDDSLPVVSTSTPKQADNSSSICETETLPNPISENIIPDEPVISEKLTITPVSSGENKNTEMLPLETEIYQSEPSKTVVPSLNSSSPFDDDVEFDFFKKKNEKPLATVSTTETHPSHDNEDISKPVSPNNPENANEDKNNTTSPIELASKDIKEINADVEKRVPESSPSDNEKTPIATQKPGSSSLKQLVQKNKPTSFFDKWFKKQKKTNDEVISQQNNATTNNETPSVTTTKEKHKPVKTTKMEQEKNKYIRNSWLDSEPDIDYDDEGNIVQGIYRIDKDGHKKIVTAFDDDTNVRYIKTSKLPMLAPVQGLHNDTRIADTATDAWQRTSENEDTDKYPEGIAISNNQSSAVEIVSIESSEAEVDDEIVFEEELYSEMEDEEIDFGEEYDDYEDGLEFDDGYHDAMFEEEIPEPEEYRAEREEYENMGIETEEAEEIDEDYEDADFEMSDSIKFKASLLSPIGEEIARLQLRNSGVLLSVLGDCKITVKGRNDAEGFSYKDARRFPRYIINTVLDKSIYRDPNMEVIDNTYFNITYFEIKSGEIIPIDDVKLDIKFDNPTPDNVKQVLYNEYKKFKN